MTYDRGQDVDPRLYPHLRRMQECVDEMARLVIEAEAALPFRVLRWRRARREWRRYEAEWKLERDRHRDDVDRYNAILRDPSRHHELVELMAVHGSGTDDV